MENEKMDRRSFLSNSFLAATALSLPMPMVIKACSRSPESTVPAGSGPEIIDTNVNLFDWPFRTLKYGQTKDLVEKLRSHRITRAWAGNFEALFHKNIDKVNSRLAKECRENGKGMLIPFGTVNPAWPDWEEDLRRCDEEYGMPGIRIYPGYQPFDLDHEEFPKLVRRISERGMILQIACDMEDSRVHHPIVLKRSVNVEPLFGLMNQYPNAKLQLLYWNHSVGRSQLERLVSETNIVLDIARVENAGGVGRLIEGDPWSGSASPVPVERVLFGSHAPYFPVEANLFKLFESPLSLDQMEAIMRGNAGRLLNSV